MVQLYARQAEMSVVTDDPEQPSSLFVPACVARGALAERDQPVLDAGMLRLRPWQISDAPAVASAYADPEIQQWHGRSMTPSEARRWIQSWAERWQEETGAGWAVTQAGELLGRADLRRIDLQEGLGEVAYSVVPAARGRGVATTAVRAIVDWAFDRVGLHRLELLHAVRNSRSCGVAGRLGFTFEGVLRQQALHLDGWHDMHMHSLLSTDPR